MKVTTITKTITAMVLITMTTAFALVPPIAMIQTAMAPGHLSGQDINGDGIICIGDINDDGSVNFGDIDPFIWCLENTYTLCPPEPNDPNWSLPPNPYHYCCTCADFDGWYYNGTNDPNWDACWRVNNGDIDPFLDYITTGILPWEQ